MIQLFDDNNSLPFRALQIYQILIGAAHNRQILTYKIVADTLGYDGAGVLDKMLGHIMFWCSENNIPPLTALVVNSKSGVPGGGLTESNDFHEDQQKVFSYNWYGIIPPTVGELASSFKAGTEGSIK